MSQDLAGILYYPVGTPACWTGLSIAMAAAFAANVGVTSLSGSARPAGMYRADVTIVATALATLAANCAFNIIGTDAAGAFTAPVPLVAGVSGTPAASFNLGTTARAAGSLIFQSTGGAADISISITGITTPGALAAVYQVVLTRLAPP